MKNKVHNNKALLIILDGWGHGQKPEVSALAAANTPYIDSLYKNHPNSELVTYGEQVGLPPGQMGNSEVGHLNIGAGRVVYQELLRINNAIKDKSFFENETLLEAISFAKEHQKTVHLMGLVSDGGVHSHINHLKALCDLCTDHGLEEVFIHAFMDGRDTSPTGGIGYLKDVLQHIKGQSVELATVIGRYYAMDRDKRWERVQLAYDLLVNAKGTKSQDVIKSIQESYDKGSMSMDEFMQPIVVINEKGEAKTKIKDGDVVIFFNFRTDRPRQITEVLTQHDMSEFGMKKLDLKYVTMTRYNSSYEGIDVVFSKDNIKNTLGEVLAKAGKTQIRIAETEKYPHVTFFFNGGREKEFEGESRILIPSPKVATYDLQPEMSALAITDAIMIAIKEQTPDFICLNYANTDMLGHTGVFKAAMAAAETVDGCVKQLVELANEYGYTSIVIADHGNSDFMINEDGTPNTAHTTNPVPCIFISKEKVNIKNGKLADIAPTILEVLEVGAPEDMTGVSLIKN
ncbi:MAG: 2,3-bisphosphoglycerate-independent phosphoglycerate mutase [Maribacter sp.]|jgi:2,3-bisphosphoglycerate-independent phosphoglycerate mutase